VSELSYRLVRGHRCYAPDADHAEVARWLRAEAKQGFIRGWGSLSFDYRNRCTCGVNLPQAPNSVSLILTRDRVPGEPMGWHLSICCVTSSGYRGYQPAEGEHWAELIFGRYRSLLTEEAGRKGAHHFRLQCDWGDRVDEAVTLKVLD
jgi:hypothetical protein